SQSAVTRSANQRFLCTLVWKIKRSSGPFYHEPENKEANQGPVDLFIMSLKIRKRIKVHWSFSLIQALDN
ncbi:MAG: hypothetical protein WAW93_01630, partial [Streptococcus suis]